jgi:flagellar biosynthesis protein FliQ
MERRQRTGAENAMRTVIGAEAITLAFAIAAGLIISLFGAV